VGGIFTTGATTGKYGDHEGRGANAEIHVDSAASKDTNLRLFSETITYLGINCIFASPSLHFVRVKRPVRWPNPTRMASSTFDNTSPNAYNHTSPHT
jgi:hypothetical protein